MNDKLLLINIILLLYRQSILSSPAERPVDLLTKAVSTIKTQALGLTVDKESQMLIDLKRTATEMINAPLDVEYVLSDLVQKIQIICEADFALFDAFNNNVTRDMLEDETKRSCMKLIKDMHNYFRELEAKQILSRYATKAKFNPDEVGDIGKFISEMIIELEPFRVVGDEVDPAVVSEVDFSDPEQVREAFARMRDGKQEENILKTGWQALNRMLEGGFVRGQQVVISALQHRNKSGFTKNIFKHIALYNDPLLNNPQKKPLLLHISFEDEMETTMEFYYKSLKENEERKLVTKEEILNTPPEVMSEYVISRLQARGWTVRFMRVNPSDWWYMDLQNKIIQLEADGYEVVACVCDYLAMMPTKGCIQGPHGVDIRDLFRRTRNFFSARKTLFITPHQLSSEAKMLVRNETMDFVKKIADGGYYAGSRQLDQEVDVEIYLHIDKVDGKSYQSVQRGKRRGNDVTPEKYKYFVLPFQPIGGLLDDILTADTSVSKPGAISQSELDDGGEQPFWLTAA